MSGVRDLKDVEINLEPTKFEEFNQESRQRVFEDIII